MELFTGCAKKAWNHWVVECFVSHHTVGIGSGDHGVLTIAYTYMCTYIYIYKCLAVRSVVLDSLGTVSVAPTRVHTFANHLLERQPSLRQ